MITTQYWPLFIVPLVIAASIYIQQLRHDIFFKRIPELKASENDPFIHINHNLRKFVLDQQPVVLRNDLGTHTPHIFNWTALNPDTRWTRTHMSQHFGQMHFYALNQHSHRLFMYYNEDRAMSSFIPRRTDDSESYYSKYSNEEHAMLYANVIRRDVTVNQFFHMYDNTFMSNKREPYIYYSQPVKEERFLHDLQPTDILEVTKTGKSVNLWIGGRRSTAQAHYDAFHNAFVQLSGSKTFLLYPPDQWLYMYLYSRHHPSYRQSQLNFQEDNWPHLFQKYPMSYQLVRPFKVTLNAGDMLYLPPYWFHHVEAGEELSVSVNVWTDCNDVNLYERMITSPIPFESEWSKDEMIHAGRVYITIFLDLLLKSQKSVIPELKDVMTAKDFIQQVIISSRYHYLFNEGTVPSDTSCSYISTKQTLGADLMNKFTQYASSLVKIANEIQPAIREMLIGNFVEDVALFVVGGDAKLVGAFLNSCF